MKGYGKLSVTGEVKILSLEAWDFSDLLYLWQIVMGMFTDQLHPGGMLSRLRQSARFGLPVSDMAEGNLSMAELGVGWNKDKELMKISPTTGIC